MSNMNLQIFGYLDCVTIIDSVTMSTYICFNIKMFLHMW